MRVWGENQPSQRRTAMKLPLISASIFAYIVLAAIWLCYADLTSLHRIGAPFYQ
jgi:hypothetical protein